MKNKLKIVQLRTYTLSQAGGDYHAQNTDHWIVGEIATPMSIYPQYRSRRSSWGIDVLGTIVVEIEASDGSIGFGVSTGGQIASWIIEHHLSRFIVGQSPWNIEMMWDQMYRSTLYYGRKGVVMNAISAIDLALWDLLGHIRQEPVYAMLGGAVRDSLQFYATGPRPDVAKTLGFIGGKLPLQYGPASGEEGLRKNISAVREAREHVGDDFWLMLDCWMALDLPYAIQLAEAMMPYHVKWIEECFPPDDIWSYQALRQVLNRKMLVSTGEHEATRWGFRLLLDNAAADFIQPDVTWCGGITELVKIADVAESHGVWVIPHGSSVYSYHFVITRNSSPFAEFLMMHKDATKVVPMFSPLLLNEPIPDNGRMKLSDNPGFGVELNREILMPLGNVSSAPS